MLGDEKTYRVLRSDPTGKIESKNNKIIKTLLEDKLITENIKRKLSIYNANAPFLTKHHKDNLPLRPITNFINVTTYHLSKYIEKYLRFVTKK